MNEQQLRAHAHKLIQLGFVWGTRAGYMSTDEFDELAFEREREIAALIAAILEGVE